MKMLEEIKVNQKISFPKTQSRPQVEIDKNFYHEDKKELDLIFADKPCSMDTSFETWMRNGKSFASPSAPIEIMKSRLADKYYKNVNLIPRAIEKYLKSLQSNSAPQTDSPNQTIASV